MWVLELHNGQGFTDRARAAWGVFFACIWDVVDGSSERYRIKQIEEFRKQAKKMLAQTAHKDHSSDEGDDEMEDDKDNRTKGKEEGKGKKSDDKGI